MLLVLKQKPQVDDFDLTGSEFSPDDVKECFGFWNKLLLLCLIIESILLVLSDLKVKV